MRTFEKETGIRHADWFGRYWPSWGEAVREAGLRPNTLTPRIDNDRLLDRYLLLARELGRLPAKGDLRLARRRDRSFPSDTTLVGRFGSYGELRARAHDYCGRRGGFEDLAPLFEVGTATVARRDSPNVSNSGVIGFVYLIKSGHYYKIGKTNSVGRRERELAILLPEATRRVHAIRTDDPDGIEAYWHRRFSSKRAHGEWFNLDKNDIAAFKRRKFQ